MTDVQIVEKPHPKPPQVCVDCGQGFAISMQGLCEVCENALLYKK